MEEGLLRESLIDEAKPLRNGSSTTDMSKRSSKSSTTTAAVVFSTLVAVCGSFCHGCASGYSSPAESGIMEDLGLSVATVGGVLRDCSGKVLGLFSNQVGVLDPISAGIMAIHKASCHCANTAELRRKVISMVSDSKIAVNWINGDGVGSLDHVNHIYETRSFLSCLENTTVVFNPRINNSLADNLAKKGSSRSGDIFVEFFLIAFLLFSVWVGFWLFVSF